MSFSAPPVVPEFDVGDLARSLSFYVDALGFSVRFERPEERFAYLTRGSVHLMLDQLEAHDEPRLTETFSRARPLVLLCFR
jgi:catechol 2,3-dioxygenase-like lactoylglutathione lyase family enzyme